jgi:hypothetical protein
MAETTKDRVEGNEDAIAVLEKTLADLAKRLEIVETRLLPKKTPTSQSFGPVPPTLTGAARGARFATTPEEAKALAKEYKKKK